MSEKTIQKKPLSPWEEMESGAMAWADFAPMEQEAIVRHYAPKIRYLALRLKNKLPQHIELQEMISAGTLGLMEALGKFQAHLGVRFDTYAENRIRGAMLDDLRKLDWLPRSLRQRIRQIDKAMRTVEQLHGRSATEAELQEMTGLSLEEIQQGLEALHNQLWVSLDAVQESCMGEASSHEEPYQATAARQMLERLVPLMDALTPREKLVLSLYYTDELNMRETAEVMGITEGRVSQLHAQALRRLRQEFLHSYGDAST